jgi:hypothetical protein
MNQEIEIKHLEVSGLRTRLCYLVARVFDYRSRSPGLILGATKFSER